MNSPVRYSDHLIHRLALRKINQKLPEIIINAAEQVFKDMATGYLISIKRVEYNGKMRPMMVAHEDIGGATVAVTVHPLEERDIQTKIKNWRWR